MSAFEDRPDFITQDARQNRKFNPINKESLESKCSILLPDWLVEDSSILDLGSCLGAAGHWALHNGADSYVGVEIQDDFVKRSRELLADWGSRASVLNSGIREYLVSQPDNSVDVIVAAGILQTFIDPHVIISEMCRIARKAVAVEAVVPPAVRSGSIDGRIPVMQLCEGTTNLAGGDHQMAGIAGILSRSAMNKLFAINGFMKSEIDLVPKTTLNTTAFNLQLQGDAEPIRYFARYLASREDKFKPTLETAIKHRSGEIQQWKDSPLVGKLEGSLNNNKVQPWEFNQNVADNFSDIAHASIPQYSSVIDKCIHVAKRSGVLNPKIIDVGCATGATLQRFYDAGYRDLVGVDNSSAMLKKVIVPDVTVVDSNSFPKDLGPFDIVTANWTLHFIDDREEYIEDISDSLSSKGLFILTEKTTLSPVAQNMYKDFKRANGLSEEHIREKELQLKGVLTPYPIAWYLNLFSKLGYDSVDVISAEYGFVTFLAQRYDLDKPE